MTRMTLMAAAAAAVLLLGTGGAFAQSESNTPDNGMSHTDKGNPNDQGNLNSGGQASANPAQGDARPAKQQTASASREHRERIEDSREARETSALNLLEANGYSDFTQFRQDGSNYAATVTSDTKTFQVAVNPDTRRVTVEPSGQFQN